MLSKIGEIQTSLPTPEAVVIGLVVAIVATGTTLWKILAHAETVVHESAHALVGILAGRTIRSVNVVESRQFRGHFHYAAFGAQLSNWRS